MEDVEVANPMNKGVIKEEADSDVPKKLKLDLCKYWNNSLTAMKTYYEVSHNIKLITQYGFNCGMKVLNSKQTWWKVLTYSVFSCLLRESICSGTTKK